MAFRILLLAISVLTLSAVTSSCHHTNKEKPAISSKPIEKNQEEVDLADIYQYYVAKPTSTLERDNNTLIEYAADKNLNVRRTPLGVYYQVNKMGKGPTGEWGEYISVHYNGYFLNGDSFDSSYKRNKPLRFKLGNAIKGWNEILQILPAGSEATILIPSPHAYGTEGIEGLIEPNTPLLFDISILEK